MSILKRFFDKDYNKEAQTNAAEQLRKLNNDLDSKLPAGRLVNTIKKMIDENGNPIDTEVNNFHDICAHYKDGLINLRLDVDNAISDGVAGKKNSRSRDALVLLKKSCDPFIELLEQLEHIQLQSGEPFFQYVQPNFEKSGKELDDVNKSVAKIEKKDTLGGDAQVALDDLSGSLRLLFRETEQALKNADKLVAAGDRVTKIEKKNEKGETITVRPGSETGRSIPLHLTLTELKQRIRKATEEQDPKKCAIYTSKAIVGLQTYLDAALDEKTNHTKRRSDRKKLAEAKKKTGITLRNLDRLAGRFRKSDGDSEKYLSQNSNTIDKVGKQVSQMVKLLKQIHIPADVLKVAHNASENFKEILETGKPIGPGNTDSQNQSGSVAASESTETSSNENADENAETSDSSGKADRTTGQLKIDNLYLKAANGDKDALKILMRHAQADDKDALAAINKLADINTSGVKDEIQREASELAFELKRGSVKERAAQFDKLKREGKMPGVGGVGEHGRVTRAGQDYEGDKIFVEIDAALALRNHKTVQKLLQNMLVMVEDAEGRDVEPSEKKRLANLAKLQELADDPRLPDSDTALSVLRMLGCDYGDVDAKSWYTAEIKKVLDSERALDANTKKLAVSAMTDRSKLLEFAAKAISRAGAARTAFLKLTARPEWRSMAGAATFNAVYGALEGGGYAEDLCLEGLKAAGGVPGVSRQERYDAIFDLYIKASRKVAHPLAILNDLGGAGGDVTNADVLANIHTIADLIQNAGGDNDETETYARAVAIRNFRSVNDCASSAVDVFDSLAHNTASVTAISAAFVAAGTAAWKLNFDLLKRYHLLHAGLNAAITDNQITAGLPTGNAMNARGNVLTALVANNNVFQATKSFCKIDGKSDGIDSSALDRLVSLGASGVADARYVLHNLAVMGANPLVDNVKNSVNGTGGADAKNVTINNYTAVRMGVGIVGLWAEINGLGVSGEVKDLVAGAMYIGYDVTAAGGAKDIEGPKQAVTKLALRAAAGDRGCANAINGMFAALGGGLAAMADKPNNDAGAVNNRFNAVHTAITGPGGALFARVNNVKADGAYAGAGLVAGSTYDIELLLVVQKGLLHDDDTYNGADAYCDAAFTKIKNAAKSNNADALKALKILSTLADGLVDAGIKTEAARDYERYFETSKTAGKLGGKRGAAADRKEEMRKNRDRLDNAEVKDRLETAQLNSDPAQRTAAREDLKTWANDVNPANFGRRRDAALALRFLKEADAEAKTPAEKEADRVLTAAKVILSPDDRILVRRSADATPDGEKAREELLAFAERVGWTGDRYIEILTALAGATVGPIAKNVIDDYKSKLATAKKNRATPGKKTDFSGVLKK